MYRLSGFFFAAMFAVILTGCIQYKGAPDILHVSQISGEEVDTTTETLVVGNQPAMGGTSNQIMFDNYKSADMKQVYDLFVTQADYKEVTSLTLQLLLVSDKVCQDYIYRFIDVRDIVGFSTRATSQIVNIFKAFNVALHTTDRITSVATGVGSIASDYFLLDKLVDDKLVGIMSDRKVYRAMIVSAWEQNAGRDIEDLIEEPYSIFQLLLDIERYHNLCSFYDSLYLNKVGSKITERVRELFAFYHIADDTLRNSLLGI